VASIKVPTTAGAGVWPAWWAVGPNWPLGGEIDMLEMSQKTPSSSDPSGDQPNLAFQAINGPISSDNTTHWSIQGSSTATPEANLDGAFHTYGVNWSPGQIQFTLDGKPTQTYTSSDFKTYKNVQTNAIWPFDNSPERLLLNLQVQTGTTVPQTMLVDYVRSFGHN
jgi:beta-glucanase (GH16 family)